MDELIQAIEKISQKDWVDYLIIIVPIMLSVIAVWISLATASKQNKIALFDMRYKALKHFQKIIEFCYVIMSLDQFCGYVEQEGVIHLVRLELLNN